jgi:hypothetical protein
MGVVTLEGIVEDGQIRLPSNVRLPEKTKVYVVVPGGVEVEQVARLISPRLARPEEASAFRMDVSEVAPDASL